jgi:general secretion pathway protein E
MAVIEYLRCDEGMRTLPKDSNFLAAARRYRESQGLRSLLEDGLLKALQGQTTVEEVLRVAG